MTITGTLINSDEIKAALKADGQLQASIIDRDPDDTNVVTVPSEDDSVTLTLKGKRRR